MGIKNNIKMMTFWLNTIKKFSSSFQYMRAAYETVELITGLQIKPPLVFR